LFCSLALKGQIWPKIFGDSGHAYVNGLVETYDYGYLITGTININEYIWVIKTDINGNTLWDKKIGNPSVGSYASSFATTTDNGFILAGYSKKYEPVDEKDPTFFKFNSCAELEWCRTMLSPGNNSGSGIIQLDDGSYIGMLKYFGGDVTTVRISLVKMDQAGEPLWIKHFCQEDSLIYNEEGWYLYKTNSDSYLISGRCYYPGAQPFWILSDTTGQQLWDLMGGHTGQAHQVIETDTGIFYSTSSYDGPTTPSSPVLFKFDQNGNLIDRYYLFGDTIVRGSASGICQISDTSFSVSISWSDHWSMEIGYSELLIVDTIGNIFERKLLLEEDQISKYIIKTYNDKILTAGMFTHDNNWDIYLWKLNSELEYDTLNNQPLTYDSLCPYPVVSDTTDYECDLFVNIDELPTKEEYEQTLRVFPNPSGDYIAIDLTDKPLLYDSYLSIYNILGKRLKMTRVSLQTKAYTLDIRSYPPGPYIAILTDKTGILSRGKFVVAR
jgi:hypothetical protein